MPSFALLFRVPKPSAPSHRVHPQDEANWMSLAPQLFWRSEQRSYYLPLLLFNGEVVIVVFDFRRRVGSSFGRLVSAAAAASVLTTNTMKEDLEARH
jgi:hypothetical protein